MLLSTLKMCNYVNQTFCQKTALDIGIVIVVASVKTLFCDINSKIFPLVLPTL